LSLEQTESNPTDISSNLCLISTDNLSLLDIKILHGILLSDSLRIQRENWPLRHLLELRHDYSPLFELIRFEFLSDDGISFFVDDFEYHELSETIWHSIAVVD
jgi:hypothetical protein